MVNRGNPYISDIVRTILKNKRRFLSIMVISMLGVMMFSGLKAACEDLRVSADDFFDAQNFHDLSIVSTLGFDEDDILAIRDMEEVESVQGIYSEECRTFCSDTDLAVSLTTLGRGNINIPYVREGRMPEKADEAAVTERFVKDTGASPGDILRIKTDEEDEDSRILVHEYTITAVVTDVRNVNNPFGSVAYRDATISADTVFIMDEAVEDGLYTEIAIRMKGTEEMFCFSEAYTDSVEAFRKKIESAIRDDRERKRTEKIKEDARREVREAEEEILEELKEAKRKLEDGDREIHEGQKELDDNMALLNDSRRTAEKALADAQRLIDENRALLERETAAFEKTRADLLKQIEDLEEKKKQLIEAKEGLAAIDDGLTQLNEGIAQLEDEKAALFMDLLREMDEETELEELFDTMDQISDMVEQLEESGITVDDETVKEAISAVLSYMETAEKDHEILYSDETLQMIAYLGTLEEETPLDETEASYEELLEVIRRYDPLSEIETAGSFLDAYNTACQRNDAVHEILEEENAQTFIELLAAADEEEDILDTLKEMKDQFRDMPAMLAEAAETEEPKTVGELIETYEKALTSLKAQRDDLTALRKTVTDGLAEGGIDENGIDDAIAQIIDGIDQIKDGIALGEAQLADAWRQLEEGQAQLNNSRLDTYAQLNDALSKIMDGYAQLREARDELEEGWSDYREGEKEAKEEFDEAYRKIDEIDRASWYIRDRMALAGYANIDSDAGSIESIGTVFPIVFLFVAILISLTAITRMVEEERGLIGTYKSLGYSDGEIICKYLIYAALASLLGGLLGTAMAFIALPLFIFTIFSIMYLLPRYTLSFMPVSGTLGPLIFLTAILGAVLFAANNELMQVPAALMRPKAPRAGSRLFLERIGWLWKRFSFLDKVTARNLFRYKKRMFMTVFGIAGCMALLLFGFAIGDSVRDLTPRQYEQTFLYDILAVAASADHNELDEAVENDPDTESYIRLMVSTARISVKDSRQESLQLFVFEDGTDLSDYLILHNSTEPHIELDENSVIVTLNAANVLGFKEADTVRLETADLDTADLKVSALADNYLGNYVYMTRSGYEKYFSGFMTNGLLINLKEGADYHRYEDVMKQQKGVISVLASEGVRDQFSIAFRLINAVVYIVILMSAALAFVVLFTLASINVSERTREIATIKVLGFFDHEVHTYIDRETLILTAIGILIGIPLGWAFAQTLTSILNLPSIYLAVSLHAKSYLIAAVLSIVFALAVNFFADRFLDRIDPAEALKSIE